MSRFSRTRRTLAAAMAVTALAAGLAAAVAIAAPPANDAFSSSETLTGSAPSAQGTTVEATREPGEPLSGSATGGSVWYSWTAPQSGRLSIDLCIPSSSPAFPPTLKAYVGSSVNALTRVTPASFGGVGQCPGGSGERLAFNVQGGTTYRFAVYAESEADEGEFSLTLQLTQPPPAEVYDLSVKLNASKSRLVRGQAVRFTVNARNLGTVPIRGIVISLIPTQPNQMRKPVEGIRFVSFDSTRGSCKRITYFAKHRSVRCKFDLAPGQSAKVTANVRPRRSFSMYVGSGLAGPDDNPRNNPLQKKTITVSKPR